MDVVLLHWLGGSARVWEEMAKVLPDRGLSLLAIDLPGFGEASGIAGYDVLAMSEAVIAAIQTARQGRSEEPCLLAGHSMGGKVATVVARFAQDGRAGLENLRGMDLFSPSPAGPEPMKESKRARLLSLLGESTGDPEQDRKHAAEFVDENTGKLPLREAIRNRAIDDVLRMNRTAFRAWPEQGSGKTGVNSWGN